MQETNDPFESTHRDGRGQKRGCLITFVIWLACLGLVFGLNKLPPETQVKWEWLRSAVWFVLIFGVPSVGILQAVALKDYLDWKSGTKGSSLFYRLLIILGCWLLALVAGGVGLLGVFATLEKESSQSWWQTGILMVFCLAICALALGLLCLPFLRFSKVTEALEKAEHQRYQQQMAHPDFAGIELRTGKGVPALYRSLFASDSAWIDKSWTLYPEGFDQDESIHEVVRLLPAALDSLRTHPSEGGDWLCFAEGDESEYWIPLGPEDPPVFETLWDERSRKGVFSEIGAHLSEFLNWPKEES